MKIQIMSDLHLEFGDYTPTKTDADIIILAGDIGLGTKGISWAKENFNVPVIYVAGNHEFYKHSIPGLFNKLREEAEGSNVRYLENDRVNIYGVDFVGCTFWTDFHLFGAKDYSMDRARSRMNDYRVIRKDPLYSKLSPYDTRAMHLESAHYLRNNVIPDKDTVVVTHHLPSLKSVHPGYVNDDTTPAYASDYEDFIKEAKPLLWVHGHTHHCSDYSIGNTRIVANTRGYVGYEVTGFKHDLVVEI